MVRLLNTSVIACGGILELSTPSPRSEKPDGDLSIVGLGSVELGGVIAVGVSRSILGLIAPIENLRILKNAPPLPLPLLTDGGDDDNKSVPNPVGVPPLLPLPARLPLLPPPHDPLFDLCRFSVNCRI